MALNQAAAATVAPRVVIWADPATVTRALADLAAYGIDLTEVETWPAVSLQVFDTPAKRAHHGLTYRELQVLHLIAEVGSNREVAKVLGLSIDTVKTHVRRLLVKFDVPTRHEAVLAALRAGWLDEDRFELEVLLGRWSAGMEAEPLPDLAATVLPAVAAARAGRAA